MKEVD